MKNYNVNPDNNNTLSALKVLILTPATRAFLEANDPQALLQAESAIARLETAKARLTEFVARFDKPGVEPAKGRIGYDTRVRDLLAAAGTPEVK